MMRGRDTGEIRTEGGYYKEEKERASLYDKGEPKEEHWFATAQLALGENTTYQTALLHYTKGGQVAKGWHCP